METYCHVAVCSAGAAVGSVARGASALTEGGEGREYIVTAACLQLVKFVMAFLSVVHVMILF